MSVTMLSVATTTPTNILSQDAALSVARELLAGQFDDFDRLSAVYANAGFPLVIEFSVRPKSLSIQSIPKPSAVELFSIGLIARTCAFANVA